MVELIVFIVIISVALAGLTGVYQIAVVNSVDPIKRVRMLELAQAQLDRVMALRYDEATPSGGVPACDSISGLVCTNVPEADLDDVDDYAGFGDTPSPGYSRNVAVQTTTLDGSAAKRISVTVTSSDGETLTLTAYRVNF
ncbi:MSHA biogenesis protein MshD [Gilvimarinus sp. DA14]|nr:MSHA biogenesis protein MshD [Gilvimarinus sp. DA14]UTF61392.1 MSHA biogenesis protein MshD [Gilvimarinus sp. DA14]